MGSFYTNVTLIDVGKRDVADCLQHNLRTAMLYSDERSVVVFDRATEDQDRGELVSLTVTLSGSLRCRAIAVLNHDDDVLIVESFEDGQHQDSYNSAPDYFDDAATDLEPPAGGNAALLCRITGHGDPARVEELLRSEQDFATERHRMLWSELGLPNAGVGLGFTYIERGEAPDGLDFTRID